MNSEIFAPILVGVAFYLGYGASTIMNRDAINVVEKSKSPFNIRLGFDVRPSLVVWTDNRCYYQTNGVWVVYNGIGLVDGRVDHARWVLQNTTQEISTNMISFRTEGWQ